MCAYSGCQPEHGETTHALDRTSIDDARRCVTSARSHGRGAAASLRERFLEVGELPSPRPLPRRGDANLAPGGLFELVLRCLVTMADRPLLAIGLDLTNLDSGSHISTVKSKSRRFCDEFRRSGDEFHMFQHVVQTRARQRRTR